MVVNWCRNKYAMQNQWQKVIAWLSIGKFNKYHSRCGPRLNAINGTLLDVTCSLIAFVSHYITS